MEKEYQGDFMSFDCIKCFNTNRVTIKDGEKDIYYCSYCGVKIENKEKEIEIVNDFNEFIKKWTGSSCTHLIDSDENDGEEFREKLRKLCEGD